MRALRHLDYPAETPVEELGLAALDALLERGDLADWAPLARSIAKAPHGVLAESILSLCASHPMYGTSTLWRTWIETRRSTVASTTTTLADLRRAARLTQVEVAHTLGMSQGDLSKLERRPDALVSTVRAYARAVGGTLSLAIHFDGEERPRVIELG